MDVHEIVVLQRMSAPPEAAHVWDSFVADHEDGWFWHTEAWIKFCLARNGGVDRSVVLAWRLADGRAMVVGVVPMIEENGALKMGNDDLPWPLVVTKANGPFQATATAAAGNYIETLARQKGIREVVFRKAGLLDYRGTPTPDLSSEGTTHYEPCSWQTRIIDLSKFDNQDFHPVRKSYRQLIRRGLERHGFRGGMGDTPDARAAADGYVALHGRMYQLPRPPASYALQVQWVVEGQAYALMATDQAGEVVGVVYWIVYQERAYYASGAFVGESVAHAMTWQALAHLKVLGCKVADLGFQQHATNEKGKAIEFFKRGFGGEDWPVPALRMTFCDAGNATA